MIKTLVCPDSRMLYGYEYRLCNLNDKICELETGLPCPYYEEFLLEIASMKDNEGHQ